MKTRTGAFPIGFRRGRSQWQSDPATLAAWAQENDISVIDLGTDAPDSQQAFVDAGMRIGSIDLAANKPMISADKATRADAIAQNAEYIATCGAANYFLVMLPENPALPRSEPRNLPARPAEAAASEAAPRYRIGTSRKQATASPRASVSHAAAGSVAYP